MSGWHSQAALSLPVRVPASGQRLPGVDALKGLACILIIWHHLAFYGPMSDVVHSRFPALTDWLYHYGRMAVQVFWSLAASWRPARWHPPALPCPASRGGWCGGATAAC